MISNKFSNDYAQGIRVLMMKIKEENNDAIVKANKWR